MARERVRLTEGSLAKVGVELVDAGRPALRCKACGTQWQPDWQEDGRLPRRWWRCPEGCNGDKKG